MNIIFGPVHSRRFGKSLGVDLSPKLKQCNYDCLYCELEGKKAQANMQDILAPDIILEEIKQSLTRFNDLDSITITANGEPTLYPHLYELMLKLEDIKGDLQTLLLTNGSTLHDPCIARACLLFDKVKFSLDAISKDVFKKIDRPHKQIDLDTILKGIYTFAGDFKGELYAEILFIKNVNDSQDEIIKMAKFLAPLPLKRLDISPIDRPPAYKVSSPSLEEFKRFQQIFESFKIPTFIPERKNLKEEQKCNIHLSELEILKTLALRPMSFKDVEILWDLKTQERLKELVAQGKVKIKSVGETSFYF
ncbi:radical SAM protein [Helicobacter burdigaliensis]|uniref:radical SAM protein n=1 Tax=Helicobacter burdigaliensis TaxID=2315334 RepID=UPI000EF66485|nr:radical SAM protein [Helicobacter burdigaliensis]